MDDLSAYHNPVDFREADTVSGIQQKKPFLHPFRLRMLSCSWPMRWASIRVWSNLVTMSTIGS